MTNHEHYRIILVEDDTALSELLVLLILKRLPTAAIKAYGNGQEALEACERTEADLLLIDHGVPGMNGVALTRTLRTRGNQMLIVGMSGSPVHREAFLAAGANDFVGGSNLYDQLKSLLQRLFPLPPPP